MFLDKTNRGASSNIIYLLSTKIKYLIKEIAEFNSMVLLSDVEKLCDFVESLCDFVASLCDFVESLCDFAASLCDFGVFLCDFVHVESLCIIFLACPCDFVASLCDIVKTFLFGIIAQFYGELSIGHVLLYKEKNGQ